MPGRPRRTAAPLLLLGVAAAATGCPPGKSKSDRLPPPPPPVLNLIAPTIGPTTGGTLVTLTGTGFQTGATVLFGTTASATATFVSATRLTATAPSLAAGIHAVRVTNPDSLSSQLASAFQAYAGAPPAPLVFGIAPTQGPTTGGTAFNISGTGFQTGASIRIGGNPAGNVAVISATLAAGVTPAGAVGPADVSVVNPDSQSATLVAGFSYRPPGPAPLPTLSAVTPSVGSMAGGVISTFSGANFQTGATVTIGGNPATAVVVLSASAMQARIPAGLPGSVAVTITNPDGGSVTVPGAFTYFGPAPTVSSATPSSGPIGGGTPVTISGSGFYPGATVTVSGRPTINLLYVSTTTLVATTTAGPIGPGAIVVTNADGVSGSLAGGFTYQGPLPTVSGVTPGSGPSSGGSTVTVTGTDFFAGATVLVGGTPATGVTWVSPYIVRATTPAGNVGPASVTVTNVDGRSATLGSAFTYVGPTPALSGVAPASGPVAGGTTITLSGTGFVAGATVSVGGVAAGSPTVFSSTQATAVTPAGVAGAAPVRIANPDGQSSTLASAFTYIGPAPTVSGVSPASGPAAGGTAVTVTGTGFVPGATVTVGGATATSVAVAGSTQVTGVTPAGAIGPATVVVTNPDGQSGSLGGGYTFQGPTPSLSGVVPASGPAAGGAALTLAGANFAAGATVTLGGAPATSVTIAGSTTITCTSPAGAAGPAAVVVTNPDGQSATLAGAYNFLGATPSLSSVSPASGPAAGGTAVTLTGTNFTGSVGVTLGGMAATSVAVVSGTSVTCVTPAGPVGPVAVVVTNADGQTATLAAGFTYQGPVPSLSSVSPGTGSTGGGTRVTLTGTGFAPGATAAIGGVAATGVTVVNSTTITAWTPAGAAGTVSADITNPDAQTANLASAYTYAAGPSVASVSPATGTSSGGTFVTVTGTGFAVGATVDFSGAAAGTVTVVSATQITCTTPAGAVGPASVTVTNPGPMAATAPGAFTYLGAAPAVSGVSPGSGPLAGGTAITVTGTDFAAGATVTVGGAPATSVAFASTTQLTATTPAGAIGPKSVVVTNPDGQPATLSGGFNHLGPPPAISGVSPAFGPAAGGTALTVSGSNFFAGATLAVGGAAATGVTVSPAALVRGTTPAGAVGPAAVTVTNVDGQTATLAGAFIFQGAAPTLSGVSPATGSSLGGTTLTLTGTNFVTGAGVTIAGAAATSVTVVSTTTATAVTPAGTVGPAAIQLTNPDLQGATLGSGFTYVGPAPTVTAVSPTAGPASGGLTVTLTGTNFAAGATVTFAGIQAPGAVTVVSATQLTCTTPAAPVGPATVTVRNADGNAGSLASAYTFTGPAPSIAGLTPNAGTSAGGSVVTVTGSGFSGGTTVAFGSGIATGVAVVSSTLLTATTPAGAMGPATVTVTTADGQSASLAGGYTYLGPSPVLSSVAPSSGPVAGGTAVTLTGTNFAAGATVTFGGAIATSVTVASASSITCVAPAGAMGPASVVVTNVDGQSSTLASGWTFLGPAPTATSVSPSNGPAGGGTVLTVTGTNFAAGATVTVGGAPGTLVTLLSATQVRCTAPAGPVGPASVTVTNVDGQAATVAAGFTYTGALPSVTSVSPASGPSTGGSLVTVTGTNFYAGATVAFGGALATSATVASPTAIACFTPSGSVGVVTVVVTNADGQSATLAGGFTYIGPAPTLSTVSPSSGPMAGGTAVTLTGTNYAAGATVTIGGAAAGSVTVASSTSITATTPAGANGPAAVVVTNPDSQTATLAGGFNYLGTAPTLGSVSPGSGPLTGGTAITLTGTSFFAGATVAVGGAAATSSTVVSSTTATAGTPAGAIGPAAVRITNPDGQFAEIASGFNYLGPAPTLTTISPNSGPPAGGTAITLTGSNFAGGATVTVGGGGATTVTVASSTTITCATPAAAVGTATVTVTNPDGQSASLGGGFTYMGLAPGLSSVSPASGPMAGGTTITLSGANFYAGATATVGGVPATSVTLVSSSSLTCVTPAGQNGPAAVVLRNPDGQQASMPAAFNYLGAAPSIASVSPASGPTAGGTSITLSGTGFYAGATVTVGGSLATSVSVPSTTQLACVAPAGAAGPAAVVLTNRDGQSASLAAAFTYVAPPVVTSIFPTVGPPGGGTTVTFTGSGFQSGATVLFGASAGTTVILVSSTQITAVSPTGTGTVSVTVTNTDGQSGTLAAAYGYTNNPVVTSVSPASGPLSGGQTVTIAGMNFFSGATADFGGLALTVSSVSATQVVGTTAASAATGSVTARVTNPGPFAGTLANGYCYQVTAGSRTAAYVWDTSSGIDYRRRWYVDFASTQFANDLAAAGLSTSGSHPGTDAQAKDLVQEQILRTVNIAYLRNADGSKVSGTSFNVTFVGVAPAAGTPGGTGASDYGRMCVGGCDTAGCSTGVLGIASYDNVTASNPCNDFSEDNCGVVLGTGNTGVFTRNLLNAWTSTLSPALATSGADEKFVDGCYTLGQGSAADDARFNQIRNYIAEFGRRVAFTLAHEVGHSMGLVANGTGSPCAVHSTGISCTPSSAGHDCSATTNVMNALTTLSGSFSDTSRTFTTNDQTQLGSFVGLSP